MLVNLNESQINKNDDIRYVLFDLYLTCYYQADSGYKLYEYSSVGLLEDNSLKNIFKYFTVFVNFHKVE